MNIQFGGIDFDLLKYDIDLYGFKTNRFYFTLKVDRFIRRITQTLVF